MQRYESYKPSGVEWLGEIPAHWDVRPGFTCFTENKDRNKGLVEKTVLSLSYGRIVIKPEEKLTGLVPESFESYQLIKPGDIVIRTTDLQNDQTSLRVGYARDKGMITSAYLGLRCHPEINPAYVFRLLESYDALKVFYGMGSGLRQNIDFWDFKRLPVPLPPRDEQDRIVAFLDQKVADVDAAIAKKERLIETLKEKRKVQISKAVTQGLNLSSTLKDSGSAAIGRIPIHWETRRLKHATQRIYDCKNRTPDYFPGGEFFVVRTTNVKKGRLVMEGALYTDAKGFSEWTRKGLPKAGELVITREAPAGEVALLPSGFVGCLGQRMMGIVPDEQQVLAKFLLYFLQSDAFDQYVILQGSGSTVSHLRVGQVFDIPLAFPPTAEEQQKIVDYLEEEERRTDLVIQQELKAIRALQEFKSTVIASTVTGRLKV